MPKAMSNDTQWLRGSPRCRTHGSMVYVTLTLDPDRIATPVSVAWSAGGLHATTPRIKSTTVTCCVPRGIFEHHALMRLQLVGSAEQEKPIMAWTQIPVLEEALFRTQMIAGRPFLSPFVATAPESADRHAFSYLD